MFVAALEWCIENKMQIVNVSMGTIDFKQEKRILDIVNKVYNANIVIVAAMNNRDVKSYPASLSNVLGVRCNRNLKDSNFELIPHHDYGVDVDVSPYLSFFEVIKSVDDAVASNSYATAFVSAIVASVMKKQPGIAFDKIKKILAEKSNVDDYSETSKRRLD